MSDRDREATETGRAGDWAEVIEALNSLGSSIGRATKAAVDDDENRRRMRELRDGLESLAARLGESLEGAAASPEGQRVKEAATAAVATVAEAGAQVAEEIRPHVLDAVRAANERFKQAAEQWESGAPQSAGVTPQPSPADGGVPGDTAPAQGAEPPVPPSTSAAAEPAAPERHDTAPIAVAPEEAPPAAGLDPAKLDAVRSAAERFKSERKAAEEAAAAAVAAAGVPAVTEPIASDSSYEAADRTSEAVEPAATGSFAAWLPDEADEPESFDDVEPGALAVAAPESFDDAGPEPIAVAAPESFDDAEPEPREEEPVDDGIGECDPDEEDADDLDALIASVGDAHVPEPAPALWEGGFEDMDDPTAGDGNPGVPPGPYIP